MRTESLTRSRNGAAGVAFFGLLAFIVIVYANPGNWFEGLEDLAFAKIAAGLSLAALGGSWLLYGRKLSLGGMQGKALLMLFALVGLSAAWSFWPKFSFDTFTDGLKYLAIFLLVVNTVDSESRLTTTVRVIAVASVIPALGAAWSHAHGEHLVEGDRAGWIGIFANPNDLAYHLVVGIAMVLAASASAKTRGRSAAWLGLLLPIGYGLALTQSRAGMFAGLAVGFLFVLRAAGKRYPIVLGVAFVLGVLLMMSPSNPWRTRTDAATAYGEDASARGRIDAWRTGINMVKDRPFSGVGAGAFMIAWPEYAPGDAGEVRSEHNTYIQLTSELGLPALFLFLAAIGAAAFGILHAARVNGPLQPLARGVQCGILGFAICSVFGGIAWTWPVYLLTGLGFAIRRLDTSRVTAASHMAAVADNDYATMTVVPALAGRR